MLTPELFLNLFWLALAVWSFAMVVRNESRRQGGHIRATALLSVLCFVALLFPIISITDDIHCDTQLAEETSATRRVRSVVEQISGSPAAVLTQFAGAAVLKPRCSLLFVLSAPDSRPPLRILPSRLSPRAPPV